MDSSSGKVNRYDISGGLGLAVDQQGHVYISGCDSDDIHRLSPDETFRDIVLSKHDGVDEPWGITFNNDFTKLFIINEGKTILASSNQCNQSIIIVLNSLLIVLPERAP
jgi:sugar lactone lactonase YvrE